MASALKEIILWPSIKQFEPLPCAGDMKFQLGSVVNTRPFSWFPYTFSIDWAARIQGRGWMVLPDSASRRSCSQGNSASNQDWTGFGFLSCLCPIPSDKMRESRGASRRIWRKGKHRRREESVEDKLYNSTILYPVWVQRPWIFFSLFCPWPQRGHGFNHYATQASQELWFYGAFTMHQMWSWPPTCLSTCAWHKGAFQGCEWGWKPAKLCLPSPGHAA